MHEVDKYMAVIPVMEDYFIAARKETAFIS
jgi:hypothetical protein